MAKKALRQGLRVSIRELRDLADELVKEAKERNASIGLKDTKMLERGWIIFIINKQPECSDTWEIEKGRNAKVSKANKKFFEAMRRMEARKKKITPDQVNALIQKVRYGEKKGKRK